MFDKKCVFLLVQSNSVLPLSYVCITVNLSRGRAVTNVGRTCGPTPLLVLLVILSCNKICLYYLGVVGSNPTRAQLFFTFFFYFIFFFFLLLRTIRGAIVRTRNGTFRGIRLPQKSNPQILWQVSVESAAEFHRIGHRNL